LKKVTVSLKVGTFYETQYSMLDTLMSPSPRRQAMEG